jgi:nicotinate-nucleotide adenylyltransferase
MTSSDAPTAEVDELAGVGRAERLGILGGTFDPPHCGHVTVARACLSELNLDRLLFVVANDPWMKGPERTITPAEDRLAMAEAAVAGVDGVSVSPIEIERGGPTYTIDTVEELLEHARGRGEPPPELFVVVGADLLPQLASWKRADDLRRAVTLAVVTRPGAEIHELPSGWRAVLVEGGGTDVSSSEVRELLEQGKSVEGLIPAGVIRCIRSRSLYAVRR